MNHTWIQVLNNWKIQYHNETKKDIEYTGTIDTDCIYAFIEEFTKEWDNRSFNCSLDDSIFSLPAELEYLSSSIDTLFEDNINISISIKKINIMGLVDYTLSPYPYNLLIYSSISAFLLDAQKMSFEEFQSFLFDKNDYAYIYIFNENLNILHNEHVIISSEFNPNYPSQYFKDPNTESIIKLRNDNIHWHQGAPKITPKHLYLNITNNDNLKNFFDSWCAILCIGFLSAYTDINSSAAKNQYISTFRGKKHVRMHLKMPNYWDKENICTLYNLYVWAYEEKTTDKISLIQNIVSLYISEETLDDIGALLSNIGQIKTIVHDNFQIYIKENIKTYLDERKKIEELINNTINEISKQVNTITDLMTKNLIGILASVLTTMVAFIAKPNTLAILAIALYLYSAFVILLTIYYGVFAKMNVILTMADYNNRFNDYKIMFEKERLTQIVGQSISKRLTFFNIYFRVTLILNVIFSILAFCVGLHLQGQHNVIAKLILDLLQFQ